MRTLMSRKKLRLGVFATCAILATLVVASVPRLAMGQTGVRYISIGANPIGQPWYQIAAGFAEVVNKNMAGIKATVEPTAGAVENARRLREGTLELALQIPGVAYEAFTGTGKFSAKGKHGLLALTAATYAYAQVATTPDAGIRAFKDLRGKRVGLGVPGSGNFHDSRLALSAHRIDPERDIKPFNVSFAESVQAIKNGQLDAFLAIGAVPQATIIELAASRGVVLIPLEDEAVRRIVDQVPFYFSSELPARVYQGQDREVRTFAYRQLWVVRDDMEENFVYEVVKLMYENLGFLSKVHPAYREMSVETAIKGLPIPLHRGAIKYYKERRVPGLEEFVEKMSRIRPRD